HPEYGSRSRRLADQLNQCGRVLQTAGFSLQDSAAWFGKRERSGLSVSGITPGLTKAFRDWASEGKDVKSMLAGQVEAIKNAESSTDALKIATESFGAEGAQRLTTGIRNGSFAIEDLAGSLGDATGTIADTDQATRTFSESWQLLKNKGLEAVRGPAEKVFDLFTTGVNAIADFTRENEWLKPVLVGIAGVLGGTLVTALTAAAAAWTTAQIKAVAAAAKSSAAWVASSARTIAAVTAQTAGVVASRAAMAAGAVATGVMTAAQWALNSALLANPMTWVVAGIVALVAAIVLIATKTDWFQRAWTVAWNGIKAA